MVRLLLWHHRCPAGVPTDGHLCLLRRHHFQYPCVSMRPSLSYQNIRLAATLTLVPADMLFGVGLGCLVQMIKTQTDVQVSHRISSRVFCAGFGSRIIFLLHSSVRSRGLADVDPHRSSGPVFGAVFHHYPTEALPLGLGIRALSPHLLQCLSSCRTSHRIWEDPRLTLKAGVIRDKSYHNTTVQWARQCHSRLHNIMTALFMQTVTESMKITNKDLCSQRELKLIETAIVVMKHICADWSRCDTLNPREIKLCKNVFL